MKFTLEIDCDNATGVACLNTGRQFIGIERDSEYFRLGSDRFHHHWDVEL